MNSNVELLLNHILNMNIKDKCRVSYKNYHTFFDSDGGFCHGPTGTFFECLMWIMESFPNNRYMERFLKEVVNCLENKGVPKNNDNYIGCLLDNEYPGEEYYAYIWKV